MDAISNTSFWFALGSIILTNIILSGDNAVVIALASRNLPPTQQKKAIFWGSAAAIILRVVLTITAVGLLTLPYLKIIGAVLLIYIGIQLLNEDEEEGDMEAKDNIWGAIRTILIADLVMSLDNVLAVAAAAQKGPEETRLILLIVGLALSIPLIVFGSTLLLKVMERFPIIIVIGAALLGFLAGEMLESDPAVHDHIVAAIPAAHTVLGIGGAGLVVLWGYFLKHKNQSGHA